MTLSWGCGLPWAVESEGVKQVRKMFPLHLMLFLRKFSPHHLVFGWKNGTVVGEKWPWAASVAWPCGTFARDTELPGTLHAAVATYVETQRLSTSRGIAPPSHSITVGLLGSDLCFVVRLRLTDKIVLNAIQVPPPTPSSHVLITLKSVGMYV